MAKIVKKFIDELNVLLKDKNVAVKVNADAAELLIKKGFNRKMGARPLQRTIDEMIKKPLSKEILFGRLTNGGVVEIGASNDTLTLTYPEILPVIQNEPTSEETESQ
jgi:ATP-dependent Clp protease ATP-binding subunit ClpA